jgi:hypothetical protein
LFALKCGEIEIRNGTTPGQKSTDNTSSKLDASAIVQDVNFPVLIWRKLSKPSAAFDAVVEVFI